MMALSWGRSVQRGPWQSRAANRVGECVVVLLHADPSLSWSSYFMMLMRT